MKTYGVLDKNPQIKNNKEVESPRMAWPQLNNQPKNPSNDMKSIFSLGFKIQDTLINGSHKISFFFFNFNVVTRAGLTKHGAKFLAEWGFWQ